MEQWHWDSWSWLNAKKMPSAISNFTSVSDIYNACSEVDCNASMVTYVPFSNKRMLFLLEMGEILPVDVGQ
jgi:hypothetical protein